MHIPIRGWAAVLTQLMDVIDFLWAQISSPYGNQTHHSLYLNQAKTR